MNEMQVKESGENEAPQIYNRATEDPLVKELKEDITRRTNIDSGVTTAVNSGRASGLDSFGDRWGRANIRETLHGYTRFVHEHPDVSQAYAEKWDSLVSTYPEIRDLPVISITGGKDLFDWANKNNVDIPDINEIQTIKILSETIQRIKRQNEESQRNAEIEKSREEAASNGASGEVAERSDNSKELEEEGEIEQPELREEFQSNEFIRNHIAERYLSYQDAELPEDTKAKMLEWSKTQDNPKKYAEAIEQMAHKENLDQLQKRAGALRDKMLEQSKKLGIPVSHHGKSISWVMWDLGKQYRYFIHPEESGEGYEIDNPLTSEKKQQEIINRHLGWEAYAAFNSPQNPDFRNRITADSRFTKALDLLRKSPKENRTLSSKDLAELGAVLTTVK